MTNEGPASGDRAAASTPRTPHGPLPTDPTLLGRRLSRILIGVAGMLAAALLLVGLAEGDPSAASAGTPLPAFDLPLLGGDAPTGERVSDAALAGQVSVINVWASWCPPCRSEAPVLRRVSNDTASEGVRFLGVVRDDNPRDAAAFVEDFDLGYPNAIDDGSLARALGVRGLPMTFVVAADGTVSARHFGPITESRLRVLIEDAQQRSQQPAAREGAATAGETS